MKANGVPLVLFMVSLALGGCASGRKPALPPPPEPLAVEQAVSAAPESVPVSSPAPVAGKDGAVVSEAVYQATKVDVQHMVEALNTIIRAKDFAGWQRQVGKDYLEEMKSADFLDRTSISFTSKNQPRLTSLQDYFLRVVVPSRDHDRVDDIEFVTPKLIKALTIDRNKRRLLLYVLEDTGDGWKITNPNKI
ncbi:hypothetical protein FACS1894147_00510 [Spirochaetia bacterium]|nr:hypothetical protein FACS1894147_00510 [Spirochaetia bacterium]